MSDERPWYREPETFIAFAALVVSVSAVVVGLYEAALQRRHDRAEVWPHVELSTYATPKGAELFLENTGIGSAIVQSVVVTLDGKPRRDWNDIVQGLLGHATLMENSTVVNHALRAGDKVMLVGVPSGALPPGFWQYIGRVGMSVCYSSVFDEHWMLTDAHLGGASTWRSIESCPAQPPGVEF